MMADEISLGQFFEKYLHCIEQSDKKSSVGPTRSAFLRIVAPALGGDEPKGKRINVAETIKSFQFLNSVPVSKIYSLLDDVGPWVEKKGIAPQQWRSDKSRILAFVEWVSQENEVLQLDNTTEQGSLEDETTQSDQQVPTSVNVAERSRNSHRTLHRFRPLNRRFKSQNGTKRTYAKDLRVRGKTRTKAYSLGCQQFNDYVVENGRRVLGNSQLQADFEGLERYQQEKLKMRPPSIKKNSDHLRSFYGWLHRYKGIPLADLSFKQQVPVFPLYYRLEDCLDENGSPVFK